MINPDAFQAIADPSRRQILHLLSQEKYNINSLSEHFEMSRPAVSKHVKVLEQAGLVSIQEMGRERYCTLNQDGFNQLKSWLEYFDQFWNNKLKNLEILLNQSKNPN